MRTDSVFLIAVVAFYCSCSKKDLNLPQPSPMPIREPVQAEPAACKFEFTQKQSIVEVAIAANEMQVSCGLNTFEILKLARDISGNYVEN